jgi:ankyrin repeat protein
LYPESINTPDNFGMYTLHYLLRNSDDEAEGFVDMLQFLLKHGQGVLKADRFGQLPLHYASKRCNETVVADAIFIRDNDGQTPLDLARNRRNRDAKAFLETQLQFVL